MNVVFVDTSYYVALLLKSDSRHQRAVELTAEHRGSLVTSEWVLAELGNFLSPRTSRGYFPALVSDLQEDPAVLIVPATSQAFAAALSFYQARSDQGSSFTDCASFLEMNARKISDAWTTDHHFEQAGFNALLK